MQCSSRKVIVAYAVDRHCGNSVCELPGQHATMPGSCSRHSTRALLLVFFQERKDNEDLCKHGRASNLLLYHYHRSVTLAILVVTKTYTDYFTL